MSTYKAKSVLRKQIRVSLSSLEPCEISHQSSKIWKRVFALPEYKSASSIGLFLSMPKGEIKTDKACQRVLDDKKLLFVPRVGLDFEQCDMDLVQVPLSDGNHPSSGKEEKTFYHDWPRNRWNIPEAPSTAEYKIASPGDIDMLIVPGLGFDREGGRLGQGKGYYDRFISKMRKDGEGLEKKNPNPLLVAVSLSPSLIDDREGIPMMDHDFRMDVVITPDESIRVHKNTA